MQGKLMRIMPTLLAGALALTAGNVWASSGAEDSIERLQLASDTLQAMINTPDKSIPEEVLNNAKCIVVIPHLVKGGFVIGGEHGRGVATCRTKEGWSAPAFVSVGGGSWGLQIGVEGVDLVMLVMNDQGLQHLLSSKFQVGADASASAGPIGRHASAGTDWKMDSEILTYSRSKGVFAGISLNGAVVEQDKDSTRAIYGRDPSFHAILLGEVRAPKSTRKFLRAISEAAHTSAVADSR
jgi:lipid-binding SYLF domain-containing protein